MINRQMKGVCKICGGWTRNTSNKKQTFNHNNCSPLRHLQASAARARTQAHQVFFNMTASDVLPPICSVCRAEDGIRPSVCAAYSDSCQAKAAVQLGGMRFWGALRVCISGLGISRQWISALTLRILQ